MWKRIYCKVKLRGLSDSLTSVMLSKNITECKRIVVEYICIGIGQDVVCGCCVGVDDVVMEAELRWIS